MSLVRQDRVAPPRTLIVGCGNLLRGDDGVGPSLVRRLVDRGLPEGVRCVDAGTSGADVILEMRGVERLFVIDACRSGSEPGSIFELPGEEVEREPPSAGIALHAFRWDQALALGRIMLGREYPGKVTVLLVEGSRFGAGEGLSPAVADAIEALVPMVIGGSG